MLWLSQFALTSSRDEIEDLHTPVFLCFFFFFLAAYDFFFSIFGLFRFRSCLHVLCILRIFIFVCSFGEGKQNIFVDASRFFFLLFIIVYMFFFFFYTSCFAFQIRTAFFLTKRKKKNTKFLSKEKVGVLQKKEKRRRKKKRGVFVVASKRCATLGAFMHLSGSTTQTFTVISVFFFVCFLRVFPMHPLPRVFSHLFRAAHLCVSTPPSLNPLPFSCFFLLLCFCSFTF